MSDPPHENAVDHADGTPARVRVLLEDLVEMRREVERLRDALGEAQSVEQAKGMLMLAYGYDPLHASTVLATFAADFGVSLRAVAERMVEASDTATPGRARRGETGLADAVRIEP